MSVQIVSVPPRDMALDNFCPICGVHNSGIGINGIESCEHLLFIYLNIADGIEYIREDAKKYIEGIDESDYGDADLMRDVLQKIPLDNVVIFEENCPSLTPYCFMIGYVFGEDE